MSPVPPLEGRSTAARSGRPVLERLHAEHGASFYLFDEARLLRNMADMFAAFRPIYPNVGIGHSYKTNYVPAVARTMTAAGARPEVVSAMEYDLALRLGQPASRIILNGPIKSRALLQRALLAGSVANLDDLQEVEHVRAIAREHPDRSLRVGLRCNFPMPGLERSRFGLDAGSGDLERAVQGLRALPNVTLEGLHCHIGGDRSAASYGYRTEQLIALADRFFPDAPPRWIDIGGGFAGRMPDELRGQFKQPPPTYADYAREIAGRMRDRYPDAGTSPELILEPGMGLLSDVFEFVCRVGSTKVVGGRHHAITTGSIYNIKPTLNKFDLPVEVSRASVDDSPAHDWIISGFTCMEIDIMHSGLRTVLAPGDDLIFLNVGAYTVVLDPPFINTAPAIVTAHTDGRFTTARRAESLDDILSTYKIEATPS